MSSKLLKVLSLGLLSSLLILSGCAPVDDSIQNDNVQAPDTAMEDAEGPIKIGAIYPLTGDAAAYGIPLQQVTQIAIDKVNEEGGIKGQPLEFIWEDGKCDGQTASAAAQKLINVDKVQIIFGGFCSSETLGAAPIAEQAGVVMLSPGSSSPDVTDAGDYIFRNYPSDASQGAILGNIAADKGFTKAGIITEENDYTLGIDKVFKETFEDRGGTIVAENYLPTDTDVRSQVTKLKGEGVDMIFVNPQTPAKADVILKQIQDLEIDVQLFGNDVVLGWSEGLQRYADLVEGMIGAEAHFEKDNPDFIALTEEFKARTGSEDLEWPTYSATTYDAVFLLKEGLEKNGNHADRIKDFLYNVSDWHGLAGSLTIDENGDPESGHKAKIVKDGATELL